MDQKNKLYVGNLPYNITQEQLKEIFEKFGEVIEAIIITDKFSGRSKGFGFVTFADEKAAEEALKMNEEEVMGRKIVVNIARPKKETVR
jgi:RNA recognition motif-containing protein